MKKRISILLAAVLMIVCTAACNNGSTAIVDDGALKIVATIFPEYDWIKNIVGDNTDNVNITLLLDSGVDLHSFQPTVDDIITISTCDLFIYVGGESDKWVDDVLQDAVNDNMAVINLLDVLGDMAKEEELKEGMQGSESKSGRNDEPEYDEHVWLSLKNAQLFCGVIASELGELDPAHADEYKSNAESYCFKLGELDSEYQNTVDSSSVKTLVFGDRFPFRYLTDDYGIEYYAAFSGCSAEVEASFSTVTFLAQKIDELSLPCVMTIESGDGKLAETIIANTGSKDQKILVLDSMQSYSRTDLETGAEYLKAMENNLAVLKEALN